MSEEAVRQTRSQKRALDRDPTPQSMEPSNSDNESKKAKLDPSELEAHVQNSSAVSAAVAEDDQDRTRDVLKQEEQSRSPVPSAFPVASQQAKSNREKQEGVEPGSDTRTDSNDRANRVKTEQAVDMKSRARVTEPKTADGMLAAGEVKATIKVEVQTAEQPVDMSTSRGWELLVRCSEKMPRLHITMWRAREHELTSTFHHIQFKLHVSYLHAVGEHPLRISLESPLFFIHGVLKTTSFSFIL